MPLVHRKWGMRMAGEVWVEYQVVDVKPDLGPSRNGLGPKECNNIIPWEIPGL